LSQTFSHKLKLLNHYCFRICRLGSRFAVESPLQYFVSLPLKASPAAMFHQALVDGDFCQPSNAVLSRRKIRICPIHGPRSTQVGSRLSISIMLKSVEVLAEKLLFSGMFDAKWPHGPNGNRE